MKNLELSRSQRFLILAAGLAAGFTIYLFNEYVSIPYNYGSLDEKTKAPLINRNVGFAITVFLFYSFKTTILSAHIQEWRKTLYWSLGFGGLLGLLSLQYFFHVGYHDGMAQSSDAIVNFFLSLHVAFFLCITFAQVFLEEGKDVPYTGLFKNAWSNAILTFLPLALVGAFFMALHLVAALFKVVDITFVETLLKKGWFNLPLMGLLYSTAIVYLREHHKTMVVAQRFALAMFKIVGVLLCTAAILFLIRLPFVGLDVLWDSRMGATLLLTVSLVTGFYANAYIGDGSGDQWQDVAKWRRWLVMTAVMVLPIFLVLCAYAFYLRIDQYGLSPDRVYAFPVIGIALVFALSYAVQIIRYREDWVLNVGVANKRAAGLAVAIALLMQLASISVYQISADNQLARIMAQIDSDQPKNLDFRSLKFTTAKPGKLHYDMLVGDEGKLGKLSSSNAWKRVKKSTYRYAYPTQDKEVVLYSDIKEEDLVWVSEMGPVTLVEPRDVLNVIWHVRDACFGELKHMCFVWQQDLMQDGSPEIIVVVEKERQDEIYILVPEVTNDGGIKWNRSSQTLRADEDHVITKELLVSGFMTEMPTVPNIRFRNQYIKMPDLSGIKIEIEEMKKN